MNKNTASDEMTILRLGYKMFVVLSQAWDKGEEAAVSRDMKKFTYKKQVIKKKKKTKHASGDLVSANSHLSEHRKWSVP